jgi:retron-type reverse transcriptase
MLALRAPAGASAKQSKSRMLRFVEHRVGDSRLISLIRRWLKANVLEEEVIHPNERGTPQGGSISVLLSNLRKLPLSRIIAAELRRL